MKTCLKCETPKSLDEFHRRGNGVQPYCKECRSDLDKRYWQNNKEVLNEKKKLRRKKYLEFYRSLKNNPCTDCGEIFHHSAMQWDHIGSDKTYNISSMKYHSSDSLLVEISKCELVCANCHAFRTWKRSTEDSNS